MTTEPLFPTVHLNGTSRNALIDQVHTAYQRLTKRSRRCAMPAHTAGITTSRGRTRSAGLAEHSDRRRRLEGVHDELGTILTHVIDKPER
jgi:hypothetical protein